MFEVLESTIRPLSLNSKILDVAYELYLEAPESYCPTIDLRVLARKTGKSLLDCRNAIVAANRLERFPNCQLKS
jgi:hypothetical protein